MMEGMSQSMVPSVLDPKIERALKLARSCVIENLQEYQGQPHATKVAWLSADVTAFCRGFGLLTETQFIAFQSGQEPRLGEALFPAWEFQLVVPKAYEGSNVIGTMEQANAGKVEQEPATIPSAPDLRPEFLELSKDPKHPLYQHPRSPGALLQS